MMKHNNYISSAKQRLGMALMLPLLMLLSSCVHNGGDIGIWFGTWNITAVEVDGVELPQPEGYHFSVNFQSQIVELLQVTDRYDLYKTIYGNWTEEADQMQWRFGSETWSMPPLPGIEQDNRFTILEKRSNYVRLKKVSDVGVTYIYTLKKLV
ncbi:MAG: hypothetical protein ACI30R_07640 [Sodaliphilus sp.]